jgi:hypothetical protein
MAAVPSQHLWAFFSPSEALPTYVAAPADVAAKDRILLLAKYAMQNGTSFVDMVRTNQGTLLFRSYCLICPRPSILFAVASCTDAPVFCAIMPPNT